jgi:hypothetical protein
MEEGLHLLLVQVRGIDRTRQTGNCLRRVTAPLILKPQLASAGSTLPLTRYSVNNSLINIIRCNEFSKVPTASGGYNIIVQENIRSTKTDISI